MVEESLHTKLRPEYPISLGKFPKWDAVLLRQGSWPSSHVRQEHIIEKVHGQLKGFTYIPDNEDRWQCPDETLARGGLGDCEDYAIYAYWLLCDNGAQADDAEVVIGYTADGIIHAVTRYWPFDDMNFAYIFDVRLPVVMEDKLIFFKSFYPLFALSTKGGRMCQI